MGTITVLNRTTTDPITMIGEMSGICYNSNTKDPKKNYERGLDCIRSNHGRTLEFPQIYLVIDGYSARVIREFGRHLGGAPTYLQASTRYINYDNFKFVVPPSMNEIKNKEAWEIYTQYMYNVRDTIKKLDELGVPQEDGAMVLPLGMETKIVYRTNLRALIDMAKVRKCNRAYHEYRVLFQDIEDALASYSEEWKFLIKEENVFKRKCEILGCCDEKKSCGRMPRKEN